MDLLQLPVLGRFLRWRHARTALQSLMLVLAGLVILDGLFGPQLAPRNLSGILPWVHWRGFVVLALLLAGNLFCMACPFMLPRRLAKRFLPADRSWPEVLGAKWVALGLLLLFFWAYEAFSLWASPWLTAWVALAYFAVAFTVDGFFRGAAFCKHVCPIGQFNFVNGMISPTEVRAKDLDVCTACTTKDCIRGRYATGFGGSRPGGASGERDPIRLDGDRGLALLESWTGTGAPVEARGLRVGNAGRRAAAGQAGGTEGLLQSGCELGLYQPRKEGNLDCTFCLECIHACPHDNVGILLRSSIRELSTDPVRSGVGRISRRPELAALAAVLVFGAFFNAFGMVEPVFALRARVAQALPLLWEPTTLLFFMAGGLALVPGLLLLGCAAASRALSGGRGGLVERISVYIWALVPLGFGMWAAHYLFHLLVGGLTILPVVQEYLSHVGLSGEVTPRWGLGPMVPESWLLPIELFLLQGGLFLTLVAGFRIAQREEGSRRRAGRAFLPWTFLAVLLFGAGVWLLLQPMEMRGTFQVL